MAHPSYTIGPTASVKINVPPEWFVSISAISRKSYPQGVFIQTNISGNSAMFMSDVNVTGPMGDAVTGSTTFPIAPRASPFSFDIQAYYADTTSSLPAKQLRNLKYFSTKVDVHQINSKKPEEVSLDIPDYMTLCIFVEDTVEQVSGSGIYDDSVVTVHLVKTNPNPIPPPPPNNVIPGYNPVLDLPRPSELENYLKEYDVVFLIDDSGSMKGERWREATLALNNLTNYIIDNGWDANGIDLRFLNSNTIFSFKQELVNNVQDRDKVSQTLDKLSPNGGTPTGERTKEILSAHIARLNAAKGTLGYGAIKPLDLIVITDGEPNDKPDDELTKVLIEIANQIGAKPPHHPNSLGVQFVQIGGDEKAREALVKLTQVNTGNIVDTIPYRGPGSITGERLERILLGALHPNIRAQLASLMLAG